MATTQVADVIVPSIYTNYLQVATVKNSRFLGSGIVATDPRLNELIRGGGAVFDVPYWNAIPQGSATPGGDTTTGITPEKLTAGQQRGVRLQRNKSWEWADIAEVLAGSRPASVIASQLGVYWGVEQDANLINMARGVLAAELASRNPEASATAVVYDEGTAGDNEATAPAATDLFSKTTMSSCFANTVGDAAQGYDTIAVHSVIYQSLVQQNLITFVPLAGQSSDLELFLGKRVIQTDQLGTDPDNARTLYTSVLFRSGAFGYGEAPMAIPLETEREAKQGNGAGITSVVSRRQFMFHPAGYQWQSPANLANQSTPADSIIATATSWNRVLDKKLAPMLFIRTNG